MHLTSNKNHQHYFKIGIIALFCIFVLVLVKCYTLLTTHKQRKANAVPVVVATAQTKTVPVYLSALGAVTPLDSVTVRTQINGQLLQVLFREGQTVKKGDLLAEIDSRPLEAQLVQYQGQLIRDEALLANAKVDLARYVKLWKQNSIAEQVLATQRSLVKQDEGNVKVDQGLIQGIQVNLIYTRITSPVNGRTGLRLVDPGNYVQVTDTNGIVIVNTLDPITVVFSLPEDNIPQVMKQINNKTLSVLAYSREQTQLLATGTLLTIDNQVDTTTGTIKLKAIFNNPQNQLFPNQFVNIQLQINTLANAIVVPTAAIQHGSQGNYVYKLNADSKVSFSKVTTGVDYDGHTVVVQGISSGEKVVVEGADNLADGMTVTVALNNKNHGTSS